MRDDEDRSAAVVGGVIGTFAAVLPGYAFADRFAWFTRGPEGPTRVMSGLFLGSACLILGAAVGAGVGARLARGPRVLASSTVTAGLLAAITYGPFLTYYVPPLHLIARILLVLLFAVPPIAFVLFAAAWVAAPGVARRVVDPPRRQ